VTEGCPAHPEEPAIAVCGSCDRALCDECFQRTVDGGAWCSACVSLLLRPVSLLVPLGLGALVVVLGAMLILRLGAELQPNLRWGLVAGHAAVVTLTAWRMWRKAERRRRGHVIATVPETAPRPPRAAALEHHPFRGTLRRLRRRVAPPVSGVTAVAVVGGALLLAAAVVPGVLRLPRWIELEVTLGVWWLVLAVALGVLLYRGQRVARDAATASPSGTRRSWSDGWDFNLAEGCVDLEGVLVVLGVILALLAGWLVVELLFLPLLFGAYLLLVAALRRAANDRHGCEGNLVRSVAWAVLWATVYTAPLAVLVWLVQRM
jgi:hypothetical protein